MMVKRLINGLIDPENFPPKKSIQEIVKNAIGDLSHVHHTRFGKNRFEKILSIVLSEPPIKPKQSTVESKGSSMHESQGVIAARLSPTTNVYQNISRLYHEGVYIPRDEFYQVLYASQEEQLIDADVLNKVSINSVFSKHPQRMAALVQCSGFLRMLTESKLDSDDHHLFFTIVSDIRDRLLYNRTASVQQITDSICNLSRLNEICAKSKINASIFKSLIEQLHSLDELETTQIEFSILAQLCRTDELLRNDRLARYFQYCDNLQQRKTDSPHSAVIERQLSSPSDTLFPIRRGNRIIACYSNAFSDKDKSSGAIFDICKDIDNATDSIVISAWAILLSGTMGMTDEISLAERLVMAAKRGVNVVILTWDNSMANYKKDFANVAEQLSQLAEEHGVHDIDKHIFIKRTNPVYGNSDHQKMVVIDSSKLYIGGLDLTRGRNSDTWHDCHTAVSGPVVQDALKLIESRWLAVSDTQLLHPTSPRPDDTVRVQNILRKARDKASMLFADSDNLDEKKESQESMQLFCSLKREAWGLPQEEWKTGTDHTRELQDAHLAMIRDAQRFIYMENQYFSGPRHGKTNSRNQVIQAIIDKIIEKHQKGEPFHFYCVLPIMPNGNPKDLKNQVIARKIWKAIKWFIDTINAATDNQCDKYVTFINLGKYAPDDRHSVNGFRQKYTHSKLLIADDDKMLIGSANCNERSMAGSEDSEVTLAMRGQQQEICQYRRELMAEHLGPATMRTLGDELEKPEAIQAVKQRLDTNLDGMFRQSDFDYSQCGLATPWGNIPTKSLSAGEQPPHVLSRTPLAARVVMGLSNVAQKAPR